MPCPNGGWRRVVLFGALIAFALQSYITQTHVHFATSQAFGISADEFTPVAKKTDNRTTPDKKMPSNEDPANCQICQAAMHSGQFITPAAIGISLPSEAVAVVPLVIAILMAAKTLSHDWQGRAPPRI